MHTLSHSCTKVEFKIEKSNTYVEIYYEDKF